MSWKDVGPVWLRWARPNMPPTAAADAPDRPAAIREQVQRILESPDFDGTDRLRRFLAYIVEESLEGRADRIKAYSIATDVFGRDSSFDAHSDPIVRVEAGHLRRALEHYYLTDGTADPVVITVPKGTYQPQFELRGPSPRSVPTGRRNRFAVVGCAVVAVAVVTAIAAWLLQAPPMPGGARPYVAVVPFISRSGVTGGNAEAGTAGSFTQAVVIELAQSRDIVVIDASGQAAGNDFLASHARYALVGSTSVDKDRLRVKARLFDTQTSSVLWGHAFEESIGQGGLMDGEQAVARSIATALAQPYGVIFRAEASRRAKLATRDGETYNCLLGYYRYRIDLDPRVIGEVQACLKAATDRHPDDATAWALTAQLTLDSLRFPQPGAAIDRKAGLSDAAADAERAVLLDPQNARALQAKMLVAFFQGQMDVALDIGHRAMAMDEDDVELAGEYGFRLALSGEWAKGCALVSSAKERLTGPAGYLASVLALCATMSGSNEEAVVLIRQAALSDNPQYHLIATLVYAQAGMLDDAKREAEWLRSNAPQLVANITDEVKLRLRRPQDREKVMASLARAGLEGR